MTSPDDITAGAEAETRTSSRFGTPRTVAADDSEVTPADESTSVAESSTSGASAPVLLEAVYQERQLRFSALDAVEMKSGVTLGFAGTLIALTTALVPAWSRWLVVAPAVIAVVVSVLALVPRKQAGLNPQTLRDKYLESGLRETQGVILHALVHNHGELIKSLAWKTRLTKWAMYALASAALTAAALVVIQPAS